MISNENDFDEKNLNSFMKLKIRQNLISIMTTNENTYCF